MTTAMMRRTVLCPHHARSAPVAIPPCSLCSTLCPARRPYKWRPPLHKFSTSLDSPLLSDHSCPFPLANLTSARRSHRRSCAGEAEARGDVAVHPRSPAAPRWSRRRLLRCSPPSPTPADPQVSPAGPLLPRLGLVRRRSVSTMETTPRRPISFSSNGSHPRTPSAC